MTKLSQRLARVPVQQKRLAPVVLPFKGWQPDQQPLGNDGEIEACGVFPAQGGYRPMPSLEQQATPLDQRARGAIAAKNTSGDSYFYAGDDDKLYEIRTGVTTDKKGTTYSTAAEEVWEFVQTGANILATNYADPIQFLGIGGGGNFADHITSTDKPKARHMDIIQAGAGGGNFLMLGNVIDDGGTIPYRARWSAIGDTTDFDESQSTQSDKEDLEGGGAIQRVVGGVEYGLIFLESRIDRCTYRGTPEIWSFDSVDRKRGTHVPQSVISHGRSVFFFTEEGFFVQNGTSSEPIGDGKVDVELDTNFDPSNRHLVSAAVDSINKLIIWAFPFNATEANKLFIFHWPSGRWATVDISLDFLVSAQTQAFTLEQLDSLTEYTGAGIDTMGAPSLDSLRWKGGLQRLAAFNTAHALAFFNGDNLAAQIVCGERQFSQSRLSRVSEIRPLVNVSAGALSCRLQHRRTQQAALTTSVETTVDNDGKAPVNIVNRYHRIQTDIAAAATWDQFIGVEVGVRPSIGDGG